MTTWRAEREAAEDLLWRYTQCLDNDELEEWPNFFADPCLYRIVGRDSFERNLPVSVISCDSRGALEDRVVSLRNANIYAKHHYRHFLGRCCVDEVSPDGSISLQTNYQVVRTLVGGASEIFSVGVYRDRVAMTGAALSFREKIVVYENTSFETLLATPL